MLLTLDRSRVASVAFVPRDALKVMEQKYPQLVEHMGQSLPELLRGQAHEGAVAAIQTAGPARPWTEGDTQRRRTGLTVATVFTVLSVLGIAV